MNKNNLPSWMLRNGHLEMLLPFVGTIFSFFYVILCSWLLMLKYSCHVELWLLNNIWLLKVCLIRGSWLFYTPFRYVKGTPASPKETWDTSLEETPEKLTALNPVSTKALEGQDFRSLSKKELEVTISHVVSPTKIFIQWLSSESKLKRYWNWDKSSGVKAFVLLIFEV